MCNRLDTVLSLKTRSCEIQFNSIISVFFVFVFCVKYTHEFQWLCRRLCRQINYGINTNLKPVVKQLKHYITFSVKRRTFFIYIEK